MLKFTQRDFLALQNGADDLWCVLSWVSSMSCGVCRGGHSLPGEELANTISHWIGLVAALIATPVLLLVALDAREVASVGGTRF
jgi:hypothetical protein